MKIALACLAALLLAACTSEKKTAPPATPVDHTQFDGTKALFEALGLINLGPRDSGTPGAERAAHYIAKRLTAAGVAAEVDVFTNVTTRGPLLFRNVIGTIPGDTNRLIIIGSHYDTKAGISPTFVGANDSGSSSGALIELGRILATRGPNGPEIQLVFFDGEESFRDYSELDGFHGSKHHAEKLVRQGRRHQTAMILLDMIGDTNLTITLARNNSPELATLFLEAANEDGTRKHFTLYPHDIGDDHVAFLDHGIPAVDIIDFDFGSAPGLNDHWHTTNDTPDKLSADSLQIVGRLTLRVVNKLSAPKE